MDISVIYERHAGDVLRFLQAQGISAATAEDIASTVWVEAVEKLRHDANARSWLLTTARWRLRDYQRRAIRQSEAALDDAQATETRTATALPLDCLTTYEREVFDRKTAGMRDREIAAELGVTLCAVKARYHRACRRLRETMLGVTRPNARPRVRLDMERVIAEYLAGESAVAIGARYGAHGVTIGHRLAQAGVALRSPSEVQRVRLRRAV